MFTPKYIIFYAIDADKILIPVFNVSSVTENFEVDFLKNWYLFIDDINNKNVIQCQEKNILDRNKIFLNLCSIVTNMNFQIKDASHENIMTKKENCVLYNFPDISEASEDQIINLLRSGVTLDDIRLKSKKTIISTEKLTHYNMKNFNVTTKEKLIEFIKISMPREEILIAICIWWGYELNDTSKRKKVKKILKLSKTQKFYCDNFLRLLSNSIELENKYLKEWCDENMENIVWDSDLMTDLENCYFENCKPFFGNNKIFKEELEVRNFNAIYHDEVVPIEIISHLPYRWKN